MSVVSSPSQKSVPVLPEFHFWSIWVWLKLKQEGQTAGFDPCFHLPGQAILEFRFFGFHSHLWGCVSSGNGCIARLSWIFSLLPFGLFSIFPFDSTSKQLFLLAGSPSLAQFETAGFEQTFRRSPKETGSTLGRVLTLKQCEAHAFRTFYWGGLEVVGLLMSRSPSPNQFASPILWLGLMVWWGHLLESSTHVYSLLGVLQI